MTRDDRDAIVWVPLVGHSPPALANEPSYESSNRVRQRLLYCIHGKPLLAIRPWSRQSHRRGLFVMVGTERRQRNVPCLKHLKVTVHLSRERLVDHTLNRRQ